MNQTAEIAGLLTRAQLEIWDGVLPKMPKVTPISELTGGVIVPGDLWFASHGKNIQPLSPGTVERALIAVGAYKDWLVNLPSWEDKPINEQVALVNKVHATPVKGVPGRWTVDFRVTHRYGQDDRGIYSVLMIFDTASSKLNESYESRRDHVVFGRGRDGVLVTLGTYGDIYDRSNGDVAKHLGKQGYYQIGEVHGFGIGSFAGFLPSQVDPTEVRPE